MKKRESKVNDVIKMKIEEQEWLFLFLKSAWGWA